jgi:Reverse transcriptase (RNA-dependent DNA polymerase)
MARGFLQCQGVDYEDTFTPVANLDSIHIILALAAQYDLKLDQMDISMAYLNGVLDKEIYLTPPKGVDIPQGHCWHLKRSLYGLKQAGRTWNCMLDSKLNDLGFHHLNTETCLYVYKSRNQI